MLISASRRTDIPAFFGEWFINRIKTELPRDPHQRGACRCAQAVDMGHYNTCSFGCIYCYASYSPRTTARNLKQHDVNSPVLVGSLRCYQRS